MNTWSIQFDGFCGSYRRIHVRKYEKVKCRFLILKKFGKKNLKALKSTSALSVGVALQRQRKQNNTRPYTDTNVCRRLPRGGSRAADVMPRRGGAKNASQPGAAGTAKTGSDENKTTNNKNNKLNVFDEEEYFEGGSSGRGRGQGYLRGSGRGARGTRGGRDRGGHNSAAVSGSQRSKRSNFGKPPNRYGGAKEGEEEQIVCNADDKPAIKKARKEGKTVRITDQYSKEDLKLMPNCVKFTDGELRQSGGTKPGINNVKSLEVAAPEGEDNAESLNENEENTAKNQETRLPTEPGPSGGFLSNDKEYAEIWNTLGTVGRSIKQIEIGMVQQQRQADSMYKILAKHREAFDHNDKRIDDVIARSDQIKKETKKSISRVKSNVNKKVKFTEKTIMNRMHHADILLYDDLEPHKIFEEAERYYISNAGDDFNIDISDGFDSDDTDHMRYIARWLISIKFQILTMEQNPLHKYNDAWWMERNVNINGTTIKKATFAIRFVRGFRDEVRNAEKDKGIKSGAIDSKCWQDRNKWNEAVNKMKSKNELDPSAPHVIKEVVAGDYRVVPMYPQPPPAKKQKTEEKILDPEDNDINTKTVGKNFANQATVQDSTKKKDMGHDVTQTTVLPTTSASVQPTSTGFQDPNSQEDFINESILMTPKNLPTQTQKTSEVVSPFFPRDPITIASQTQDPVVDLVS